MLKPNDYDSTKAASFGDSVANAPAPGGHGAIILKAEENNDFGKSLWIFFDIKEGSESDDYYKKSYERSKKFDSAAKWKGILKQPILQPDGSTSPYFKGLITAIEKSNPGYHWAWDENSLKGKKVGLVFRNEGFYGTDGQKHTVCRAAWACDIDSYKDMPVPKPKEPKLRPQPTLEPSPWQSSSSDVLPF